jgi:hypothetical protein
MFTLRRLTGASLLIAFVLATGVQCLLGQLDEMSCCPRMASDCHTPSVARDCCERETLTHAQLVGVYAHPLPMPVVLNASSPIPEQHPPHAGVAPAPVDTTAVKGSPPPPYVLSGTLLI